jgi:hypothetical protein
VAASDGVAGSEGGQPSAREGEGNGVCLSRRNCTYASIFSGCGVDVGQDGGGDSVVRLGVGVGDGDTGGRKGGAASLVAMSLEYRKSLVILVQLQVYNRGLLSSSLSTALSNFSLSPTPLVLLIAALSPLTSCHRHHVV